MTQRYRGVGSSSALHQLMHCRQSREASSSNEWSHAAEWAELRNYIQFYAVPEILLQRLQYLSPFCPSSLQYLLLVSSHINSTSLNSTVTTLSPLHC